MWTIKGRGGRLRIGARELASFGAWQADETDGVYLLRPDDFEPDPYWWEHRPSGQLVVEVEVAGTTRRLSGELRSEQPVVLAVREDE